MGNKGTLIGGGIGLVVLGLVLGWLFDGSDGDMHHELAEMRQATAKLGDQLKELKNGAGENASKIAEIVSGQEGLTAQMAEMKDNLAASAEALRGDIAASADAVRGELNDQIGAATEAAASLKAQIAGLASGGSDDNAAATEAPKADAPAKAEAAPVAAAQTLLSGAGRTATITEGLRVFLARMNRESGEAIAAVNGLTTQRFRSGQPVAVAAGDELCTLTLANVSDEGASFDHACGDDVAAPEGVRVGETATVNDGLRVFVSRLDATEGSAVIAINGLGTRVIDYDNGISVTAGEGRCDLMLDNIDRGHAALSLACPE